ncbi:MAG TPA: S8 family peptidase [Vicinamibacterales bacterium]|nr:S8 family peptidase [Vicinamibacterales bacterium]
MARSGALVVVRVLTVTALVLVFSSPPAVPLAAASRAEAKLDSLLRARLTREGRSRVLLQMSTPGGALQVAAEARLLGAAVRRELPGINAVVVDVPNRALPVLAANPLVERVSHDRLVAAAMDRTSATVGARAVREQLNVDGSGIGVAVIDSGITPWHDDLGDGAGGQRVARFVDFVNGLTTPYDDYGHGTHVAGIVAGNGFDSGGARSGMAPGAHLVALKVLNAAGEGRISDVIAALDYVVANKDALNIRVVNLSVAGGVHESYLTDPLTLAARRVVAAGIVVVAAAGNYGRGPEGRARYAGVTSPGNAPWVLTVGASSHMGTADRADDTMAPFSSRGPGAVDYAAKPDVVAPGVGIESLTDASSALYAGSTSLLSGTAALPYFPYMSLTGSSMAAPVASGTIALMLQANPSLTPNAVKAILQYTAQPYAGHDFLTQGAGFINARGAVQLAKYLGAPAALPYPATSGWSRHLIWGNHLARGGRLTADANAWSTAVTWGEGTTATGDRIRWGLTCTTATCDALFSKPWQTVCADLLCSALGGDAAQSPNVVWGALCAGLDCPVPWSASTVTATSDPEADTVVWGTSDTEGDTVVWGTSCRDPACEPVVWNRR